MKRYRMLTFHQTVNAVQWNGDNIEAVRKLSPGGNGQGISERPDNKLTIATRPMAKRSDSAIANPTDYIIAIADMLIVMPQSMFERRYRPA